jgi:hypothetical protein
LGALYLCGCAGPQASEATHAIHSQFTGLQPETCQRKPDPTDPNNTPYLACPGIAGYTLRVRKVESGRTSLDVVDSTGTARPLNLQDTVTRHMANLTGQAEWRVATTATGAPSPIALIVRVQAREDDEDPEKVTQTYLTVAKITPDSACVTDRLPEGAQSADQLRAAADTARQRPCVSALPPRNASGPERH